MCVLAHVRIGGGEEIVKKMGLGTVWRMVRSVLALAWTVEVITSLVFPARLSAASGAPALLSDEFTKYSWAAGLMASLALVSGFPRSTEGSRQPVTQFLKLSPN